MTHEILRDHVGPLGTVGIIGYHGNHELNNKVGEGVRERGGSGGKWRGGGEGVEGSGEGEGREWRGVERRRRGGSGGEGREEGGWLAIYSPS